MKSPKLYSTPDYRFYIGVMPATMLNWRMQYVGLCVEFPSLSWLDKKPEAALAGIRNMVAEAVQDMKANKETPPEPIASRRFSGKFLVRVPPELHRRLMMEAQEEGISLNRLASDKLSRQDI